MEKKEYSLIKISQKYNQKGNYFNYIILYYIILYYIILLQKKKK